MSKREVWAKHSFHEVGIGSVQAKPAWESDPTDEGAIVRLDVAPSGDLFFSMTDAEEFDGSYVSVQITRDDLIALDKQLTVLIRGGRWEHVPGFGDVIIGPEPKR